MNGLVVLENNEGASRSHEILSFAVDEGAIVGGKKRRKGAETLSLSGQQRRRDRGSTPTLGRKPEVISCMACTANLLYKDYQSDHQFSLTSYTYNNVPITTSGTKKGDLLLAEVNTQLKNRNVTTDIKVDTNSKLFTTVTVDEPARGLKTIFSFVVPDQKSGKAELQYFHDHAGISTSIGLTANPIVKFSGVLGSSVVALGTDVAFDTATGNFTMYNAGLSYSNADLIASLNLNDKGDTLVASYFHSVSPLTSTAVGAELSHSFSNNESTLTICTQHALDPLTLLKASALIQHQVRPKSFFTISGEVDTRATDKSAKVGLSLALKQ
ncbi:hypothetical protein EJ110_NYTH49780 [Nymphaea thermarum]|nr:hypothetical protein EJ110_NYTH49780 [Nymphaea thermarum]